MISLCIPTYNRSEMVIESFSQVLNNQLISEIIIVDDFSKDEVFQDLKNRLDSLGNSKVRIFRNPNNKKAFLNKLECVKMATNEWIVLLDSDNILTNDYLESIPKELDANTFYLPSHAMCQSQMLDYREYSNLEVDKEVYKKLISSTNDKIFCMLNTGNYFINKKTYIEIIEKEKNILDCFALDPFYMIFLGYKNIIGFNISVVENMKYYHRLHDVQTGSYYLDNSRKSQEFMSYLKNNIHQIG